MILLESSAGDEINKKRQELKTNKIRPLSIKISKLNEKIKNMTNSEFYYQDPKSVTKRLIRIPKSFQTGNEKAIGKKKADEVYGKEYEILMGQKKEYEKEMRNLEKQLTLLGIDFTSL